MGPVQAVGHSLCPGWSLKAFWKTFYFAPRKHHPSLIAAVLWGGENTPVLADIILFSAFVQIQRALDVSWLSCLLTNSKSLRGSLCFPAPGFQGSVRGVDWGSDHLRKHWWRKPKLSRTREEELGASMMETEMAEHLASSDQPKLLFYLKHRQRPIDCWDMF